jgi:Leucine-rich repeat (LRR) protein
MSLTALVLWLSASGSAIIGLASAGLSEREILQNLYLSTGGSSWNKNDGWEDNSDDVCSWYGVACVGEEDDLALELELENELEHGRRLIDEDEDAPKVIGLDLKANNLSGRTPSSLYELQLLQVLSFSFNNNLDVSFIGSENAAKLKHLKIHETATTSMNALDGFAATLIGLHMSGVNMANTAIPPQIFALTSLKALHLAECELEGNIPDAISKLDKLEQFNVFGNHLTGTLPFALSNLRQLQLLTMSGNKFSGTIPGFLEALSKLQNLYLDDNHFTGTLPSFQGLPDLMELWLNSNYLQGTIPSDFLEASVHTDIIIDLANNRLSGTIPSTLDALQDTKLKITLTDNMFTKIDESLCDNTNWMDGHLTNTTGCDAIVCPVGTYGKFGRATSQHSCNVCDSGLFVGQTYCLDTDDDHSVLEALYSATGGPNWKIKTSWMTDENVCTWYGITCWDDNDHRKGRVRHLQLDDNNLVGTIPQSIFAIETLTTITIARNPVVMQFDAINTAPHMRKLNVAATNTVSFDGIENAQDFFAHLVADKLTIGGTIPTQIFQLSKLETLSMSDCGLSGTLESGIGNMASLVDLYLYENELGGPLPSTIGNLVNLTVLSLAKNKITGVLPSSLNQLSNLQALSLTDQVTKGGGMSGEISTLAENTALTTLLLGKNKFEGAIPSDLLRGADLDAPLTVDLSFNLLTGTVPGTLSRFGKLNLMVQNNYISGIDKRLCVMDGWMNGNVREYGCDAILCPSSTTSSMGRRMFDNEECSVCSDDDDSSSTTAAFYGQTACGERQQVMTEREILELLFDATDGSNWHTKQNWYTNAHFCEWYGISCDDGKSVVSIVLGSNQLRGTVPTAIYQLPNLARVSLFGNTIEFSFDGIDQSRNLKSLILDSTGLKSLEGVGNARGLKQLNVRFNALKGTIPDEVARLVHLESLEVSNNELGGPLPSWLGKLPVLETFGAANNKFHGPLLDFGNMKNLAFLDFSDNELYGTVPANFLESLNAKEKIFVDFSRNYLSGTVPADLERLERLSIRLTDNKIDALDKELCLAFGWNDNAVESYGCQGILCPAGTYSKVGRQSTDDNACETCKQAKYMGATNCSGALTTLASLGAIGYVLVSTVYLVL